MAVPGLWMEPGGTRETDGQRGGRLGLSDHPEDSEEDQTGGWGLTQAQGHPVPVSPPDPEAQELSPRPARPSLVTSGNSCLCCPGASSPHWTVTCEARVGEVWLPRRPRGSGRGLGHWPCLGQSWDVRGARRESPAASSEGNPVMNNPQQVLGQNALPLAVGDIIGPGLAAQRA